MDRIYDHLAGLSVVILRGRCKALRRYPLTCIFIGKVILQFLDQFVLVGEVIKILTDNEWPGR